MRVLVDMDDVLDKLVVGWVKYNNEKFNTNVDPETVDNWDLAQFFKGHEDEAYEAEKDDHMWDFVGPLPGGPETLKKIIDDGHEVFIVSATYYETLKAKMEKVLFRYYPYIDWKHVVITYHKELIQGDVLIDDGIHNLTGERPYIKLLFTANHNKNFDASSIGAIRVNNWDEAYEEVKRIAREKEENR